MYSRRYQAQSERGTGYRESAYSKRRIDLLR